MVEWELREPIPVLMGGMTLDPARLVEIPGYQLEVEFAPPSEEELAFQEQSILARLGAGLISRVDAIRERYGSEDAEEKLIAIDVDRLAQAMLAHPGLVEVLMQPQLAGIGAATGAPVAAPQPGLALPGESSTAVPAAVGMNGAAPAPLPGESPTATLGGSADMLQQMEAYRGAPIAGARPGPGGM